MRPRPLLPALLIFGTLALIFGRYDLDISRRVVDVRAPWAVFGERYGSLPGVYAIAVSATLLQLGVRDRATAARRWLIRATGAITLSVAVAVTARRIFDHSLPVMVVAGLALGLFALLDLAERQSARPRLSHRLERVSRSVLVLGISSWLVVSSLKWLWGRVRYRDLDVAVAQFTPWYQPQGFTGHVSFPSGHTAMGWVLLPIVALWPLGSRGSYGAIALVVGWGAFVATSRVVVGAHYASDVLFSTALAVGIALRFGLDPRCQRSDDDSSARGGAPTASPRG